MEQLIFIKELGEGAFGRVYLGSCINLCTGKHGYLYYCTLVISRFLGIQLTSIYEVSFLSAIT